MNERISFEEPASEPEGEMASAIAGAASLARKHATPSAPKCIPEQARLKELEAANARLLNLVGELLVANQKLRERSLP